MSRVLLLLIFGTSLTLARAQLNESPAAQFIPWLLGGKEQFKQVPFADVVRYATGRKVLPINREDATDRRVLKQIGTALDEVIKRMSAPGSRPASHRIWKPLHEPITGPPTSAKAPTAAMIGEKRAIAPVRR